MILLLGALEVVHVGTRHRNKVFRGWKVGSLLFPMGNGSMQNKKDKPKDQFSWTNIRKKFMWKWMIQNQISLCISWENKYKSSEVYVLPVKDHWPRIREVAPYPWDPWNGPLVPFQHSNLPERGEEPRGGCGLSPQPAFSSLKGSLSSSLSLPITLWIQMWICIFLSMTGR